MLWRISLFTSSGSQVKQAALKGRVNAESLRIQYSTAAQHSYRNDFDVTRVVAYRTNIHSWSVLGFTAVEIFWLVDSVTFIAF